ncbi:MAG: M48 family metalloprotease [Aquabacterium sp.]|jgi:predicted Zn-dependent protease|uniref:M48 family metalloprotease n=1 Tax=Aquabacterium sp. TaxID=1872578 RepID=UPI002A36282F|nr:M48 family metalloprotease [Aquabacterium sp.]MDX9843347.1 M48 family metalloprotease [Aquabacterium sp.]
MVLCAVPVSTGVLAQEARTPPAPLNLPALGDSVGQDLSPRAERRLGDRIMRAIRSDPAVIDDPLVLEYVQALWDDLLRAGRQRGEIGPDLEDSHAWEPFLVRDKSVNAFALPGGYIGVHLGLMAMTTTTDELASVLAHELSHVTQRHIARMMGQQARTSWMSMASMVLGILAASRNPAAAQALIYGGQAATIQGQLNFSRDMEREADRVGFTVLSEAGFEPGGMARMFEHLQQASRLNDDGSFPYLRTHPLTSERIGEARARMGPDGWTQALRARPSEHQRTAWHALMSARAQVLMDPRSDALHRLATLTPPEGASALQRVRVHYTVALAKQRTGQTAGATAAMDQARQATLSLPASQQPLVWRILTLSEAEGLLEAQRPREAVAALKRPALASPMAAPEAGRPELLLNARLALAQPASGSQANQWRDAANQLQTHLSQHPHDAAAWALLSELWRRLEQPLRAIRADAEATAALGDLPGAIDRIQGAHQRFRRPDAADVIELSVMDARLKVWQRQQREDLRDDN